jgi:hypothetical protein
MLQSNGFITLTMIIIYSEKCGQYKDIENIISRYSYKSMNSDNNSG